jgi:hypothetical protein
MSVLKNKRGLSKLEFYHNARELRKLMIKVLLRDFGIKNLVIGKDGTSLGPREPKPPSGEKPAPAAPSGQISGEVLAEAAQAAVDSWVDEGTIEGEFPQWALNRFRNRIWQLLDGLMGNITDGNSIYPSKMDDPRLPSEYVRRIQSDELADRRRYQDAAIGCCQKLIQELQCVSDILPVRMDKMLPFMDMINFEIRLLKGWRKSTNELAKRIGQNGGIGEEKENG